ncbi:tetratricopeptide repeat protein [Candidatus Gracilibacteria bacterium]|nr:tetratricopeptide repeat protein [Candidatus Gracilibacteria bacterium]
MNHELPIIDEVERLKAQKRYSEARVMIEGAISRYLNRYELYEELADVYIYEGEYARAEKALNYAETLESSSSTGLYLRGYMALIRNDFSQAIKNLEESNQKSPNNPEVLRNLGWAYTMMGDVKKGVILLERALTIAPDDMLIMEDLGVALLTQGKIQEAREYLSRVGKESHMSDMGFPV